MENGTSLGAARKSSTGHQTRANFMLASAGLETEVCKCCFPAPLTTCVSPHNGISAPLETLSVSADPSEIAHVAGDIAPALLRVFRPNGLLKLFGTEDPTGARRIERGGTNRVFMVEHNGRLARCTRQQQYRTETSEAERLIKSKPGMLDDIHVSFPMAAFVCLPVASGAWAHKEPCEVTVFKYFHGCRPLCDILRMFEHTHHCGPAHRRSPCIDYRENGICEHIKPLQRLIGQQLPKLIMRFQALYHRRHGNLKADNVLVERNGNIRLVDFLNTTLSQCDRNEFMCSTLTRNGHVQDARLAFDLSWRDCMKYRVSSAKPKVGGCGISLFEMDCNIDLLKALESLSQSSTEPCTVTPTSWPPVSDLLECGSSLGGNKSMTLSPPHQRKCLRSGEWAGGSMLFSDYPSQSAIIPIVPLSRGLDAKRRQSHQKNDTMDSLLMRATPPELLSPCPSLVSSENIWSSTLSGNESGKFSDGFVTENWVLRNGTTFPRRLQLPALVR